MRCDECGAQNAQPVRLAVAGARGKTWICVEYLCPACRYEAETVMADRDADGETPTLKMRVPKQSQDERAR
jgi:hypothetical protein